MSEQDENDDVVKLAEERFRLVVESSPAGMVIVDRRGEIVLVNRQAEVWFGYDRSELIGQNVEVLIPQRFHNDHVSERDEFLTSPQARPMGAGHELFAQCQDGSELPVDISLHPMHTREGVLVMAHIVDLTDRKQAELEIQKRHAFERLALLGQLAGGVAHEIRNPLGVIRNAAYYLNMVKDSLDEESRESVKEILEEVDRANRIVSDLLDFARESPQRKERLNLVALIRDLIAKRRNLGTETVEFKTSHESLEVMADSEQIRRILDNLIVNGVQASGNTGTIQILLRETPTEVVIDVVDQGEGIKQSDRLRIFEPLFTTKAKGIGLGLAVSKRYAERNDGSLDLVDHPGPGTIFRLTLPKCEDV